METGCGSCPLQMVHLPKSQCKSKCEKSISFPIETHKRSYLHFMLHVNTYFKEYHRYFHCIICSFTYLDSLNDQSAPWLSNVYLSTPGKKHKCITVLALKNTIEIFSAEQNLGYQELPV